MLRIGYDAKRLFRNFTGLGNYSRTLLKNLSNSHPENHYILYTTDIIKCHETKHFLDNRYDIIQPSGLHLFWRSFGICKDIENMDLDIFHG
ncbi:MAG: glycosyltransferase family 1 protein, partial [Bacteroidales bacterium]